MKVYLRGSISDHAAKLLGRASRPRQDSEVANLSGIWKLSLAESDFGNLRTPRSIDVAIEHREPQIRYFGIVTDPEGRTSSFDVQLRLDGTSQVVDGVTSLGWRVDSHTINSEWSRDGSRVETTVMRVSRDGRTLLVHRRSVGTQGAFRCSEVYEKQVVGASQSSDSESNWSMWRPDLMAMAAFNRLGTAIVRSLLPE